MQQAFVPVVHDLFPLGPAAAGAHGECDAAMAEAHGGLRVLFDDVQEIALSPQIVTLTRDERAPRLPRLTPQLLLPVSDPNSFEIAYARATSRRVSIGATNVTRPPGGYTDKCACFTAFRVTVIAISPSRMVSLTRTPGGASASRTAPESLHDFARAAGKAR